jgi:hypothetical protein
MRLLRLWLLGLAFAVTSFAAPEVASAQVWKLKSQKKPSSKPKAKAKAKRSAKSGKSKKKTASKAKEIVVVVEDTSTDF